jgi:hypothetical protein
MVTQEMFTTEGDEKNRFVEYLEWATMAVRSWPLWKQALLGQVLVSPIGPVRDCGTTSHNHAPDLMLMNRSG